ncbi:MAG: protein-tyrosine-phosphatase [Bacteroidota bacterium]
MVTSIENYVKGLTTSFHLISEERKMVLESIGAYIQNKILHSESIQLVYICTHNSRRSHFGQVWAHVAADYYRIKQLQSFSGGTEATAFHPNAIAALQRIGFDVQAINNDKNTLYHVFHDHSQRPSICFSKCYDDPSNPQKQFAAIMTCSDADENCPFIPGAESRFVTKYNDPKTFDGSPEQDAKYDKRCQEIARETFYIFSRFKQTK